MVIRIRAALIFIFVAISVPSFAQALDLFQYIDNVLGNASGSQKNIEITDQDSDWSNSIIVDPNAPAQKPQQVVQNPNTNPAPAPKSDSGYKLPLYPGSQPTHPIPQLPPQTKIPQPQPLPRPQDPQFAIQPKILKEIEKKEPKMPLPSAPAMKPWSEDKKAHWEKQVHEYYGQYLGGGEASMERMERERKTQENAKYFDPEKARVLDPNKYLLPWGLDNKNFNTKWRMEPLVYLNFDLEKKITNMMPYDPGNIVGQKLILQPAGNSQYGYEVNHSRNFGIGSGPGIQSIIDYGNPTWANLKTISGFVAATALISEVEAVSRHTETPNQSLDINGTAQPTVENILNHWNLGETYRYGLRGGFLITGGVTWYAISVGPTFIKEGTSEHTVTKIGPDKVMVEVRDIKSHSGMIGLNAVIAGLSMVTNNNIETMRYTFFYDLSMPAGARAFSQLMHGNYMDTMVLIAENKTVSVALVETDVTKTYLNKKSGDYTTSLYLGLPFFYWNWTFGKTSDEGALTSYIDQIETRYYHKLSFDNHQRRLLFNHKYVTSLFYAGIEQAGKVPLTTDPNQDYYGRFLWNFQSESARRSTLRSQLDKMIYFKTGLEELDVDLRNVTNDLDYTNAEVIMHFDKETTDTLLRGLQGGGSDLKAQFRTILNNYEKTTYPDDLDYCQTIGFDGINAYRNVLNEEGRESIATARENCKFELNKRFFPVIEAMILELEKMRRDLKENTDDSKQEFVKHYRRFGELMMTNRFTFRTVYNYLLEAGAGDIIRYIINGEKIANMVIYFPSGKIGAPLTSFQK